MKKLPTFGVGPLYVISTMFITLLAIILHYLGFFRSGYVKSLLILFIIFGIVIIIYALVIYFNALFKAKIDEGLKETKLITKGIYSVCRNPIYTAFLFFETGLLLFTSNLYFLILPIIYYLYLTVLLKYSEEKWLEEIFKEEYLEYKKKVPRIIPIFKKRKKA